MPAPNPTRSLCAIESIRRAHIERLAREVGLRPVQIQLVGDPTYQAFNDALFALSSLLERITPQGLRVHIVGDYTK